MLCPWRCANQRVTTRHLHPLVKFLHILVIDPQSFDRSDQPGQASLWTRMNFSSKSKFSPFLFSKLRWWGGCRGGSKSAFQGELIHELSGLRIFVVKLVIADYTPPQSPFPGVFGGGDVPNFAHEPNLTERDR